MKKSDVETLSSVIAILVIALIFGGAFALFTNWILSMIFDWPITWSNWGITWGSMIVLRVIFGGKTK
jgi:hypothetical protein